MKKLVSVVIRTLNEEKYLEELLAVINKQESNSFDIEVIIVDSGSTDNTLTIASKFSCRITYIKKEDFTFGRSLNVGCEFANGQYLVFVSGHCIPTNNNWLHNLVSPLANENIAYSYGKQIGRDTTKFSECQLFEKYFPDTSSIPQDGIFCNNANSALRKDVWENYHFDETLTGCEDMYLAKVLTEHEYQLAYVADAAVYHIHDEPWEKVQLRYEREAIALQKILPEVHVSYWDMVKYIAVGIVKDFKAAIAMKVLVKEATSIIAFRYFQYSGAYKGNHKHRQLSQEMKLKYFYPRISDMTIKPKLTNKD